MLRNKLPSPFEKFHAVTATDLINNPSLIQNRLGVYALLVRDTDRLLEHMGVGAANGLIQVGAHAHVYTGESANVCSRVLCHLRGDREDSNVRETLLAAQHNLQALDGEIKLQDSVCAEAWLSDWLESRVIILYKHCSFVCDVESDLLARTASPFNVGGRPPSAQSAFVKSLRRQFKLAGWPRPEGKLRKKYRR